MAAGWQGIFVLSLDVANDRVKGDLSSPQAVAFWTSMFWQGRVAALVGEPPCETWSQARHHEVAEAKRPPRPLRSAAAPWGVKHLKDAERHQLEVGSNLMRTQVYFMFLAGLLGIPAVQEHPIEPSRQERASCWRIPELRHLMQQDWAQAVDFDQCQAGACGQKPTRLAVIHAPEVRKEIRRLPNGGWCWHSKEHHRAQLGLTHDNRWRTAPSRSTRQPYARP